MKRRTFFWRGLTAARWAGAAAVLLAFLAGGAADVAKGATPVLDINVGQGQPPINVNVVGNNPALEALMSRAFAIHGAFASVSAAKAEYTLKFDGDGANKVTVTAEPKTTAGTKFSKAFTGGSWQEAAAQAADYVVEQLTHAPGFFGGKLAFVRRVPDPRKPTDHARDFRELFSSDVLGQKVLQLTNDKSEATVPHWSPDGTKLLFTSMYASGFPDVILYDLTTGRRKVFANFQGTNTGATFSPDGRRVALILSASGNPDLYVGDASGSGMKRLTTGGGVKSSPAWSPDGKQIVVSSDGRGSPLLYVIPATGGTPAQLATTGSSTYCVEAAWNPKHPNLIAFSGKELGGNGNYQIMVYDMSTRAVTILTHGADAMEPCWANDGRHIFFTLGQGGGEQLALVDSQTGKVAPITSRGGAEATFVYPGK